MTLIEQQHKIAIALQRLFERRRVVFWYDKEGELREIYEQLQLDDVEKQEINQNEFYLKYRILREMPKGRFLLYSALPCPRDEENWLLDVQLSNEEFHAELTSLHLQDVGLTPEFKVLADAHKDFFGSEDRKAKLQKMLAPGDVEEQVRLKMMAVTCGTEPEWDKVLFSLIEESVEGKEIRLGALQRFNLSENVWRYLRAHHGYDATEPTVKEWVVLLLRDSFEVTTGGMATLTNEARLFVNRWKENVYARKSFEAWSGLLEEELNIRQELARKEVTELLDADTFACIDKAILSELLHHTVRNTQPIHLLEGWIGRRKNRFFSEAYKQTYAAIGYALQLMEAIRKLDVEVASPAAGFKGYATRWYLTDRLYRNYVLAAQQSEYPDSLKPLSEEVEKMYGNTYLLRLGDNWQAAIRNLTRWGLEGQVPRQRDFYKQWVQPYIEKNNRIFVIISDALRYESATELRERIASEDRFTANITATLGVIPSYTQLGMAAMLPHRELTFDNHSDTVFVDGISSQGTANRTRILQQAFDKSVAIGAEDFLNLKAAGDGREFAKQYQVIYIYSNTIDKTGDDKNSESEVFRATETEFDHLIRIVKQIANMNGNNILITADHGYIYQNRKIEETDFTDFTPEGEVYKCNRRFVIGRDLAEDHAVKRWDGDAIGLADDTQVLTANSINRIRVQGAGSRFVHGGCSLQEIVVPVIEVTKNRKSDLSRVEVDVIGGAVNITGNIFPVSFYQTGPVSEKVQPRTLRGAFYSADGVQLSDSVSFTFDSADNDSGKREKRHTFSFGSDASRYNRQEIYLRLDEVIEGTTQMRAYKSLSYRVMIAFSSEFDFD